MEVVCAKTKFQRILTPSRLLTFHLAYSSHNRLLERPSIGKAVKKQSWVHLLDLVC